MKLSLNADEVKEIVKEHIINKFGHEVDSVETKYDSWEVNLGKKIESPVTTPITFTNPSIWTTRDTSSNPRVWDTQITSVSNNTGVVED